MRDRAGRGAERLTLFPMPAAFQLKFTADFFDAAGKPKYQDIGLSVLAAAPHIKHAPFAVGNQFFCGIY